MEEVQLRTEVSSWYVIKSQGRDHLILSGSSGPWFLVLSTHVLNSLFSLPLPSLKLMLSATLIHMIQKGSLVL